MYTVQPYWTTAPFSPTDPLPTAPPKQPMSTGKFVAIATAAAIAGFPFAAAGLFLCFTVIGIIPGIGLILVAGAPLALLQNWRAKQLTAWRHRDQPLPSDLQKPWEE